MSDDIAKMISNTARQITQLQADIRALNKSAEKQRAEIAEIRESVDTLIKQKFMPSDFDARATHFAPSRIQ
jgi:uncharacterized protein HemX